MQTKNMVNIPTQLKLTSFLRGTATRLLIDRLSSDLHSWGPCIVHCRLACHPVDKESKPLQKWISNLKYANKLNLNQQYRLVARNVENILFACITPYSVYDNCSKLATTEIPFTFFRKYNITLKGKVKSTCS